MYDTWIISDTHFLHSNLLNFTDEEGKYFRGDLFKDTHHMDQVMIENWNRIVKPGDKVYHLGDVFIGQKEKFKKLWPRLNGRKNLIVGNHDDIKFMSSGGFFKKVYMWRKLPEHGLILTHVPVHPSTLDKKTPFNVHGHIHQNKSPSKEYFNVSVENINYTPIHMEEVKSKLRKAN